MHQQHKHNDYRLRSKKVGRKVVRIQPNSSGSIFVTNYSNPSDNKTQVLVPL